MQGYKCSDSVGQNPVRLWPVGKSWEAMLPAETGRDGGEKTCTTATEKLLCSRYSTYTVFPAEWGGGENTASVLCYQLYT